MPPRQLIPAPVMSVCADIIADRETHSEINSLFAYAGAPDDPPTGNKQAKALTWLRIINKDPTVQPLEVLGRLIEKYMEAPFDDPPPWAPQVQNPYSQALFAAQEKIVKELARYNLQYVRGGKIVGAVGAPSRTLEQFIKERDTASIEEEFNRALQNVGTNPRDAVSAASNILESLCKIYIEEEKLEAPSKQDLQPIWNVVRKDLGFDPSLVEDQDLQKILSGMISVVHGIGDLRTHASSAHGAGKKGYLLEPRHARLAIHAAHTVTLFILESWAKKKEKR